MSKKAQLNAVQTLLAKGKGYWDAGRPKDALTVYEKAFETLKRDETCKHINTVIVGQNLAVARFETGQLGKALSLVEQLIALKATEGFPDLEMDLLRLKAAILERLNNLPGAAEVLEEIRPDKTASSEHVLKWNNAAGIVAWRRGLVSDALNHFRASVAVMSADDQSASLVAAAISNAAILNYEIGLFDAAHELHERMVEHVSKTATIASRRGLVRLEALRAELASDLRGAAKLWEDGIEMICQRNPNDVGFQLDFAASAAKLWARVDDIDSAVAILERVRDRVPLEDRNTIGSPDVLLADLLITKGAINRARELLVKVADQVATRDDIELQSFLFSVLARLAQREQNDQAAVLFGKLAISGLLARGAVAQRAEGALTQASMSSTLSRLKDALHRLGRYAEAARIQHLAETRSNAPESFAARALDGTGGNLLFAPAESRVAAGWLFRPELETDARGPADVKSLLRFNVAPIPAKAAAPYRKPAAGVVLVQYAVGEGSVVILGQRGRETVQKIVAQSPADVFALIGELRTALVHRDAWLHSARRLYDLLIEPIQPVLEGASCLELVTGGALNDVPLACLLGPDGFLCEVLPLHRVVLNDIPTVSRADDTPMRMAAFGGKGDTRDFARAELDHIARIFPEARCFHNRHSNLHNFRSQLSKELTHLHYSGHFDLNPVHPELSRLTFGSGEDLYLGDLNKRSYEMTGLELVCFSACNSGVAGATSHGPLGLANAVLARGARHVLATHWPVFDSEASTMMAKFYNRLAANASADPVLALHQVQSSAARATRINLQSPATGLVGGIGSGSPSISPSIWSGFSLYSRI